MKNRFGYGKHEVVIVILVLLFGSCYLGYSFLGNKDSMKFHSMRESSINFSRTVTNNSNTFHNSEIVYLQELVDEKLMKNIKNPFSKGFCDTTESKVERIDNHSFVTLKCGNYLIDNELVDHELQTDIYQVSSWSNSKPEDTINFEVKALYNCMKDNNLVYPNYLEESYLVYLINKENNTDFYSIGQINPIICNVDKQLFYRTKELIDKKKEQ